MTLSATICPEKSNSLVYTVDNGSKNLILRYLGDGEACEAVVVQRPVVGLEEKRLVVQEPLHLTDTMLDVTLFQFLTHKLFKGTVAPD